MKLPVNSTACNDSLMDERQGRNKDKIGLSEGSWRWTVERSNDFRLTLKLPNRDLDGFIDLCIQTFFGE